MAYTKFYPLQETYLPELKSEPLHVLTTTKEPDFLVQFSLWTKIQRVVCYVWRFINGCTRKLKENRPITASELKKPTHIICKVTQRSPFQQDMPLLKSGNPWPWSLRTQRLSSFVDEDALVRVGSHTR